MNSDPNNDDYIKWCLSLSPEKRLENLEQLNDFFNIAMPKKSKEIAVKLNEENFYS